MLLSSLRFFAASQISLPWSRLLLSGANHLPDELDQIEEGLRVADGALDDERLRLIARLHVLPVLYRDNQQVLDVRNRWAGDAKQL